MEANVEEVNVVWNRMLCGSECYMETNVEWNGMLYGTECCVKENVVWK